MNECKPLPNMDTSWYRLVFAGSYGLFFASASMAAEAAADVRRTAGGRGRAV